MTNTRTIIGPSELAERALQIAAASIGQGEEGGNNRGPAIDGWRAITGVGGVGGAGPWCAVAFGAWYYQASLSAGPLLFDLSAGAWRLYKNMGKAGRFLSVAELEKFPELAPLLIGAAACWHRGAGPLDWQKHIGMVSGYGLDSVGQVAHLETIEGNKNIKGQRFAAISRFPYPSGRWKERLVGFAIV